jgi:hypothetical protein
VSWTDRDRARWRLLRRLRAERLGGADHGGRVDRCDRALLSRLPLRSSHLSDVSQVSWLSGRSTATSATGTTLIEQDRERRSTFRPRLAAR